AATGSDRYAGWSLFVAYSAPGMPLRNLTVFDGFAAVANGSPQTITVSGFQAPLSGTVDTRLSMVAYEGDLTLTGDYTKMNSTQLATADSPGSNFFDSTDDTDGTSVTARTPAYQNMMGFDIKNLSAPGAVANDARSATFTFSSNGDVYYPGVLATAISLYAPDFSTSTKTVQDLAGNSPAQPGDTLQYVVQLNNTGQDPARQMVSTDVLPAGTAYVPGSLALLTASGSQTPLTDQAGDDVGEFTGSTVQVRVGTGATATAGGQVPAGGTTGYAFQATVLPGAAGTTISNSAHLAYVTGTLGIAATYDTPTTATPVISQADLALTKTMTPDPAAAGQELWATLTVVNNGPNTATGVTLTDPAPTGTQLGQVDVSGATGASCTISSNALSCALPDMAVGDSDVVRVQVLTPSGAPAGQTSVANVARVAAVTNDPAPGNNVASATAQLTHQADLSITKTPASLTATPGSPLTYTLTISNAGPSDATGVVVTDRVPADSAAVLSLGAATSNDLTCAAGTGTALTCTAAALAAGQSASVTVNAQVASLAAPGATFTNQASVVASTPDPDTTNNAATSAGTVGAASADVRLTKSVAPTTLIAGGQATYTIVATNWGPSDATEVQVNDALPDGFTLGSVVSDRGTCTQASPIVCTVGTLPAGTSGAPGASATITISGRIAPDQTGGTYTNTATATATSADPDLTNNTATATAPLTGQADLSVTKTSPVTLPPNTNDAVSYTITVHNAGPSTARNATLADLIPAGLVYVGASLPAGVTCDAAFTSAADGSAWNCQLGDVPVGPDVTLTLNTQATQTGTSGMVETATVSADTPDPDTTNNQATWTFSGTPQADLQLTKTAQTATPWSAGGTGTFALTVTNAGPSTSTPTITDTLPDGLTPIAPTADGSQTSSACTVSGQQVTCAGADLAADATWTVQIEANVSPDVDDGTVLTNTASVTGTTPDPSLQNNQASAQVPIAALSDMAVTGVTWNTFAGTDSPPGAAITTLTPGTFVWMTIDYKNLGAATAKGTALVMSYNAPLINPAARDADTGDLSPYVVWNNGTFTSDAACTIVSFDLHCPLDDGAQGTSVPPGGEVSVRILFGVPSGLAPGTTGLGWSFVSSITPDANADNNEGETPLDIGTGVSQLQVAKYAAAGNGPDGQLVAGTTFSYMIQVSQPSGPIPDATDGQFYADAQGVQLTDPLPAGFHATSALASQGTCAIAASGSSVACDLGVVPAGFPPPSPDPVTVVVSGTIDPDVSGDAIPNTASATTTSPTQTPGPATGTTTVDVIQQADLQLFKYVDATPTQNGAGQSVFEAGNQVGYTLTALNAGPSASGASTITDTLPLGLVLDAASTDCTVATPGNITTGTAEVITCAVGALDVGASQPVRVVTDTLPGDLRLPGTGPGCQPGAPSDPDDASSTPNAAGCDTYATLPRTLDNEATIAPAQAGVTDPNPDNNAASALAELDAQADLSPQLVAPTTAVAAGSNATYTLTVVNAGPSAADSPVLTVTLPAGFGLVSATLPGYTCQPATQNGVVTLTCVRLATGPLYQTEPVMGLPTGTITVSVPPNAAPGTYVADASITATTPDPNLANNQTSASLVVQRVANTKVTKTLATSPLVAGQNAQYVLTVTNQGPSVVDDAELSDTVPTGMTFVTATDATGAACPAPEVTANQTVIIHCPMGALGVGESATALVTLQAGADTGGQELCNTALVGSEALDPDSADNE
ncbi:MAG: hypothetical protein FWF75_06345, partial [Propionibacteriaceae bacterium]|nr:hypothetical protein [Propionibacteriaceae bacterium]